MQRDAVHHATQHKSSAAKTCAARYCSRTVVGLGASKGVHCRAARGLSPLSLSMWFPCSPRPSWPAMPGHQPMVDHPPTRLRHHIWQGALAACVPRPAPVHQPPTRAAQLPPATVQLAGNCVPAGGGSTRGRACAMLGSLLPPRCPMPPPVLANQQTTANRRSDSLKKVAPQGTQL